MLKLNYITVMALMVYVLVLCTTIVLVLCSTVSRMWIAVALNIIMVDAWYSQVLGSGCSTHLVMTVVTSVGHHYAISITPSSVMLVAGIAVAMHGVSTYAHTYMGYEVLIHVN